MPVIFRIIIFSVLTALSAGAIAAQSLPSVEKVEPPNWWANHTIKTIRLLVRGTNFQSAKVTSANKSLQISNVRINSRGDYLFFDVKIAPGAKIAKYEFEVSTAAGKTKIPFEISAPLDPKSNFQGITSDDVIYLVMTDRFSDGDTSNDNPPNTAASANDRNNPRAWHGGDFRGLINHLDYFKELGITAIWLTPWYDNSDDVITCDKPWCPMASYHGYGAIDYYTVENHFGTMTDLRELIAKAHTLGIKVIQDQVANHVGFKHPWAKNAPLDDWFSPFAQNTFNNSVLLSPNSSAAERNNLIHGWFDFSLPDLNQDEPEVAGYETQNALWWIGMTGIDGIRQDTIQYLPRKFISDWSGAILKQYPKFYMVGEVFERDSAQTAFFQGGKIGWDGIDTRLPSDFDFKLWETSLEVFTGRKPAHALRDVLKYDGLYPNINRITTLQNNHDTKRFMSIDGATLDGAMLHTAFLLAARGIPQLYYGEELAMKGGDDPFNRADFPGGWQGDAVNRFTKEGRTRDEQKMFEWTRAAINARKRFFLANDPTIDDYYDDEAYIFSRVGGAEGHVLYPTITFAFNFAPKNKAVKIKSLAGTELLSLANHTVSEKLTQQDKVEVSLETIFGNAKKINVEINKNGDVVFNLPPKSVVAFVTTGSIFNIREDKN